MVSLFRQDHVLDGISVSGCDFEVGTELVPHGNCIGLLRTEMGGCKHAVLTVLFPSS